MRIESRFLGSIEFESADVYTFPRGIAGFEGNKKFVLARSERTLPARWLVSIDEGGPELALLDPQIVGGYSLTEADLKPGALRALEAGSLADTRIFCVLTVPDEIRRASLNLRAPILLNTATMRGYQHLWPADSRQPVRKQVYGDLVSGDPLDRGGMVVTHRKVGETIEIGPDITVQVLELADGGVRLGVYAPRRVAVNRGRHLVTAKQENRRASKEMHVGHLESLLRACNARRQEQDTPVEDPSQAESKQRLKTKAPAARQGHIEEGAPMPPLLPTWRRFHLGGHVGQEVPPGQVLRALGSRKGARGRQRGRDGRPFARKAHAMRRRCHLGR